MERDKRNTDIKVTSVSPDLNKGDDEKFKSNKYAADPEKVFWGTFQEALERWVNK